MANSNQDNARENPGVISDYRKKKYYTGYEDDSVSGKAALEKYNELEKESPSDIRKMPVAGGVPYSPSRAEAAQAKQREVMNERRRETKDTVPEERLKKGGAIKMAKGGMAKCKMDGCAVKGKTKGTMR
jgi:hypothetical protein